MPGRTTWRSTWLPFGCWLAVLFGLSSVPNLSPPEVGLPTADKLAHLAEYAVLGMLFERTRSRPGRGRSLLRGAVLGLVVGTLDELYQRGTPGRESTWTDVAADLAGAAVGTWGWRLRQERRLPRPPAGRS